MRLKRDDDPAVAEKLSGRLQSRLHGGRVVSVVIDEGESARGLDDLKPAPDTGEPGQSVRNRAGIRSGTADGSSAGAASPSYGDCAARSAPVGAHATMEASGSRHPGAFRTSMRLAI